MAISSLMVTVATMVAKATANSVWLKLKSCFQRGISSSVIATNMSRAASAAMGMRASSDELTATRASRSSAEKTAASGVRAPACRFGMDRFMDPQDT